MVCLRTTHSSGSRSPRVRSRVQWVSMKVGIEASQMMPTWAPPSARPSAARGCSSIWRVGSRLPDE